jgi:RNA polymerase sigma-70 factor (ECF subfamily)
MTEAPTPDDAELLRASAQGDREAFTALVTRHQQGLYAFVWRQVRNHAETADICQQVLVKVFLKAAGFRGDAAFRTWLYQIAINHCRNHFRARARERVAPDVDLESLPAEAEAVDDPAAAGDADNLRQAVAALPPKQRQTLQLRFYQDCTFAEIATIMSCPIGTAKANYHHAVTTLRRQLRGDG